jgi:hypothetical protein
MNFILLLLLACSPQRTTTSDSIVVVFDAESAHWANPPGGFSTGDHDVVEGEDERDGQLAFVRYDLDGDGTKEYFLRLLCGTGGCEYAIYDGNSLRDIGSIFGSPIWILIKRANHLPLIESYSHQSAEDGNLTRYAFNGREYRSVRSKRIANSEVDILFDRLRNIRKLK